jgi:hypothetical protein
MLSIWSSLVVVEAVPPMASMSTAVVAVLADTAHLLSGPRLVAAVLPNPSCL